MRRVALLVLQKQTWEGIGSRLEEVEGVVGDLQEREERIELMMRWAWRMELAGPGGQVSVGAAHQRLRSSSHWGSKRHPWYAIA